MYILLLIIRDRHHMIETYENMTKVKIKTHNLLFYMDIIVVYINN